MLFRSGAKHLELVLQRLHIRCPIARVVVLRHLLGDLLGDLLGGVRLDVLQRLDVGVDDLANMV